MRNFPEYHMEILYSFLINESIAQLYSEFTNRHAEITNQYAEITNRYGEITNRYTEITNRYAIIDIIDMPKTYTRDYIILYHHHQIL